MANVAGEGILDAAVAERLLADAGLPTEHQFITKGKGKLDAKLEGYNAAAALHPWMVLRDMDHDAPCPPALIERVLPNPAPFMCFRVARRSVESWLMADAEHLSLYLKVSDALMPLDPDALDYPKRTLLEIAARSRNRDIRRGMLPESGTSAKIGPLYNAMMSEFAQFEWDPATAARRSTSLARAIHRLTDFARRVA